MFLWMHEKYKLFCGIRLYFFIIIKVWIESYKFTRQFWDTIYITTLQITLYHVKLANVMLVKWYHILLVSGTFLIHPIFNGISYLYCWPKLFFFKIMKGNLSWWIMAIDTFGDLRMYRPGVRDKNALMWSNRFPYENGFSDHLLEYDRVRLLSVSHPAQLQNWIFRTESKNITYILSLI